MNSRDISRFQIIVGASCYITALLTLEAVRRSQVALFPQQQLRLLVWGALIFAGLATFGIVVRHMRKPGVAEQPQSTIAGGGPAAPSLIRSAPDAVAAAPTNGLRPTYQPSPSPIRAWPASPAAPGRVKEATLRVVGMHGQCLGGYRVGDVFSCSASGEVQPVLCTMAATTMRPLLAAMVAGAPEAPRQVMCPIPDHALVFQLDGVPSP